MEDAEARKERLKALRQAAEISREDGEDAAAAAPAVEEPVLKFRNYSVRDEKIAHEKVEAVQPPAFEEVHIEANELEAEDGEVRLVVFAQHHASLRTTGALMSWSLPSLQDVSISVAPKKANWDLRRDIADKLARLERRTQGALVKLMTQEESQRLTADGGIQDLVVCARYNLILTECREHA